MAFTSQGKLLVAESEGKFTIEDWTEIHNVAENICCDRVDMTEDDAMEGYEPQGRSEGMMSFVKSTLEQKVTANLQWKD
jgi:exosome complex component RRP46